MNLCAVCGMNTTSGRVFCSRCQWAVPPSLYHACLEEKDGGYRLGLSDGTQMEFDRAEVRGKWATLWRKEGFDRGTYGHAFPLGIDIRLETIVWCSRDPDGLEQAERRA